MLSNDLHLNPLTFGEYYLSTNSFSAPSLLHDSSFSRKLNFDWLEISKISLTWIFWLIQILQFCDFNFYYSVDRVFLNFLTFFFNYMLFRKFCLLVFGKMHSLIAGQSGPKLAINELNITFKTLRLQALLSADSWEGCRNSMKRAQKSKYLG